MPLTKNIGIVKSMLDCYNLAYTSKYKTYAIQNGQECWVSNILTRAQLYGQCSKCTRCSIPNVTARLRSLPKVI